MNSVNKETFSFQTEVGRLLDIVASSLYSNREIFLRELVSNASDACDKLRYDALIKPELTEGNAEFQVDITVDKDNKFLSISDNGIGMNHADLLDTLGTIAKSGTQAFLEHLEDGKKGDVGLIGQFGVGFYSAFMVSDHVDVITRRAGEDKAWLWSSDGKGEFTIEETERESCGTTVKLHLKEDAEEFLEDSRIRHIIKTYSDHINFPVKLGEDALNAASALWTRPTKDVDEEQHKEFYHHIAHAYDDPWLTIHNHVEGLVNYTNLLYVPTMKPMDLNEPERKGHVKLYVNRVFITEDAKGLLPTFLRFLRGVVDSEDLSLNVSREMLQHDPKLAKIRSGLTKKVLNELKKKAKKDEENYASFWSNFGAVLKEGMIEDAGLRERILEICRFSSTHGDRLTSLADYVSRMKEGQDAIYYITGEKADMLAGSPHLEGFKAKGIEVLLLTDHVDDFWLQHVMEYEGKSLKSVTRGSADLDEIKSEDDTEEKKDKPESPVLDELIAAIKLELGETVKDVRASKRLTDSPVCLVADEGGMDLHMERILKMQGHLHMARPRVLELNPDHAIVKKLADRVKGSNDDNLVKDAAHLLLDQARIADGEAPADPLEFGRRLSSVLESAL
ncbi:molecular chaperone HtpG [Flexibacterium corallicola]|uniref:molecular chaperone HtpG n=1 Tax=Flexibacterium corallicola TaxID=3037259 RepID=UPI00286EB4C3|nr:molecular chaperone HtpG [Pseudovibrio sp. M1P-2-3]